MALSRVKTWIPGDILTASDLNAEFNNLLNNPISLVSPTTGTINFNLQTHTNLVPTAITGTSAGLAGSALVATSSAPTTAQWSTGMNFVSTAKLLGAQRFGVQGVGTSFTTANLSISTAWGAGAQLSAVAGADQAFVFTVTASAPTAANPTVATTFNDAWTTTPLGLCLLTGGTGAGGTAFPINVTGGTTGQTLQMFFTPTGNLTYIFTVINMG